MTNTGQQYWISPEAYSSLCARARQAQFIRSTTNDYGISLYLSRISMLTYRDTRPLHILDLSASPLIPFPIWSMYPNSWKRTLSLHSYAIQNYLKLALQFNITRTTIREHPSTGRIYQLYKDNVTKCAIVGAVLEAIGSQFLTPIETPPQFAHKTKTRKPKYEINF